MNRTARMICLCLMALLVGSGAALPIQAHAAAQDAAAQVSADSAYPTGALPASQGESAPAGH